MVVSGIEELHNILFDILCTIDDICKKENVRYFLDCGTEIGAAREHDFIPWDDDMDIKVLSEDYPAFKIAMEKCLPPYMHIIEPDAFSPAFYDFTIRVYDERYTLRKETERERYYKNYQNYVGTDVFLLCKSPDSGFLRKKMLLKIKILYGLGMAHRFSLKEENKTKLELLEIQVLGFFGKFISVKRICKIFFKTAFKYQHKKNKYRYSANNILLSIGYLFPEKLYGKVDYLPIRGRLFPVPYLYDKELSIKYGDWRTPKENGDFIRHLDGENG